MIFVYDILQLVFFMKSRSVSSYRRVICTFKRLFAFSSIIYKTSIGLCLVHSSSTF